MTAQMWLKRRGEELVVSGLELVALSPVVDALAPQSPLSKSKSTQQQQRNTHVNPADTNLQGKLFELGLEKGYLNFHGLQGLLTYLISHSFVVLLPASRANR